MRTVFSFSVLAPAPALKDTIDGGEYTGFMKAAGSQIIESNSCLTDRCELNYVGSLIFWNSPLEVIKVMLYFLGKRSEITSSIKSKHLKIHSVELVEPLSHIFLQ